MSNLFDDETDNQPTTVGEYDPSVDYFAQLVGDGKKYKDPNALAYSRLKADEHVKRVEREAEEQRKETERRMTYDDLWKKIQEQSKVPTQTELEQVRNVQPEKETVTEQKLQELLDQRMTDYEKRTQAQKNRDLVKGELQKVWGADFNRKLSDRIRELELDQGLVESLADSNPKALLRLVMPTRETVTDVAPPRSSIQSTGSGKPFKKMSEFTDMLKTRAGRRQYLSPETQDEITRLTNLYGEEFLKS